MAKNIDAGMSCIKYLLFISNFMFTMIGFILFSIGSSINSIYSNFARFMEAHYFSPAALLVAIGVITFFVALFGCLGAIRESTLLVNIYAALLSIILILEISAAIAALSMRSNIVEVVKHNMFDSMDEYGRYNVTTESWDFAQGRLMCCGVHNIKDWSNYTIAGTSVNVEDGNFTVPWSCCSHQNCEKVYESGCLDRLTYIVSECAFMLGSGAVCVALVQVLGIVFAGMLAKAIRTAKTNQAVARHFERERIYNELAFSIGDEKPKVHMLYTAKGVNP